MLPLSLIPFQGLFPFETLIVFSSLTLQNNPISLAICLSPAATLVGCDVFMLDISLVTHFLQSKLGDECTLTGLNARNLGFNPPIQFLLSL